jgi:hypothetical protein
MRDAGMSRDQTAARLGHADEGELLDELYDRGDRSARVRRELDVVAPEGLLARLAEDGEPPSTRPATRLSAEGKG